jgi:hypothetical protein
MVSSVLSSIHVASGVFPMVFGSVIQYVGCASYNISIGGPHRVPHTVIGIQSTKVVTPAFPIRNPRQLKPNISTDEPQMIHVWREAIGCSGSNSTSDFLYLLAWPTRHTHILHLPPFSPHLLGSISGITGVGLNFFLSGISCRTPRRSWQVCC